MAQTGAQGLGMEISITDLGTQGNEILWALKHNEDVRILSRGKLKGIIRAAPSISPINVRDHPFFGMLKDSGMVDRQMQRLRRGAVPRSLMQIRQVVSSICW